jgi:hypothetical protein
MAGKLPAKSDVGAFLEKLAAAPVVRAAGGRGRLIFAMDATASREPTWDQACHIQGEMFVETESLGGLEVQLCAYGGFMEFDATPWVANSAELLRHMAGVRCRAGQTQILRVLRHAAAEHAQKPVQALVFVGDAFEEDLDAVADAAGRLGIAGLRAFVFHEGHNPVARRAFEEIARLTGGACCRFDASSARQLRDLLAAVAVYAAGGRKALADFGRKRGGTALLLAKRVG